LIVNQPQYLLSRFNVAFVFGGSSSHCRSSFGGSVAGISAHLGLWRTAPFLALPDYYYKRIFPHVKRIYTQWW
jgi:hypothetical protein